MEREKWKEHDAIEKLQSVLRVGIMILAVVVMVMLVVGTVLRFIGISWAGYVEIFAMLVFWFYMLGTANGSFENIHMRNTICDSMVKFPKVKHTAELIKWIVVTICGLCLCWWGAMLCISSVKQGMATQIYGIPMIVGYIALVLGMAVSSLFHVLNLVEHTRFYIETYVRKEVAS